MLHITNPILPGFNPDPSIARVGDDFYIATSTFHWFPGVQIWHSRNLRDWTLKKRPLDETRLLDLRGLQSSAGIWAPCLSFHDGIFYLIYTVVSKWRGETPVDIGIFKDTPNFMTCATSVDGPWADPIYLNASGFDPSLFHDSDNRSWLINMEWDYRAKPSHFSGILLQEYDKKQQALVGPIRKIFTGSTIGRTEGPHLYKRNGWYYLMTAEGGTAYEHAVTLARSQSIEGPYELHPQNPLLHSLEDRARDQELIRKQYRNFDATKLPAGFYTRPQRAGHGSMCPLSDDEWALVYLCSRPIKGSIANTRGRETGIQRLLWKDDQWPYAVNAQGELSNLAEFATAFSWNSVDTSVPAMDFSFTETFSNPVGINPHFRFLRSHPGEDMIHDHHAGHLLLKGRGSMVSELAQSVVAVSTPFENYRVEIDAVFEPDSFQQMAGLLAYYDERNQYYLRISYDEGLQCKALGIIQCMNGRFVFPLANEIPLEPGMCSLALEVQGLQGQFYYRGKQQENWNAIGPTLAMGQLSDECTWPEGFTGTFLGMACHDQSGRRKEALFKRFSFVEL